MTRTASKITAPANVRQCACGTCVETTRGTYAPGHDARHVGLVAREIVRTGDAALLDRLPSTALRIKAVAMVERLSAPKAARPAKAPFAPAEPVKVGRWTYPARVVDGNLVRNTKRDGSGEWIAA